METYALNALELLTTTLRSEGKSRNTINSYESDVKLFIEANKHVPTYELLGNDRIFELNVRNYIDGLRVTASPATVVRRAAALRAFARVMGYPRMLDGYKLPTPGKQPAHPLPSGMDDVKKMLEAATDPIHRALIALCAGCGARVSEARAVRTCDFTTVNGQSYVRLFGKGSKERFVPVPGLAYQHIRPVLVFGWSEQRETPIIPLSDRGARQAITDIAKRAGVVRNVASHDLRMTFGTTVYATTKDIRATQELLGHASSSTTERYTGISDEAKIAAIGGIK